jgi:hypothetical protein
MAVYLSGDWLGVPDPRFEVSRRWNIFSGTLVLPSVAAF